MPDIDIKKFKLKYHKWKMFYSNYKFYLMN